MKFLSILLFPCLLLPTVTGQVEKNVNSFTACLEKDTCPFAGDGECDAGTHPACPEGSDCVDCDPFIANCTVHALDCEGCNSQPGCAYCAKGGGLCYPAEVIPELFSVIGKDTLCEAEDWTRATCEPVYEDNVFADPLYDGMKWSYDLINVEPVWEMGFTGKGIHVRVDDDGVDSMHPEFAGRYDKDLSCEVYESTDPEEVHGTACASIIAAAGDNDQCAVGIAPNATISSCKIDPLGSLEDIILYKVETVDVSSNSIGPFPCRPAVLRRHLQEEDDCPIDSQRINSPCAPGSVCRVNGTADPACTDAIIFYCRDPLNFDNDYDVCQDLLHDYTICSFPGLPDETEVAFAEGTTVGRGGLGTIYVFAAGNERGFGSDANYDTNSISRYTIAVGAVGKRGKHASYSNAGANVLVSAPGGDGEYIHNNLVANPTIAGGGCANIDPGTSFATPTVSGIVALMLEANSGLGWRDVQAIIATTSTKTDPEDESWSTNGAGLHHSNKYGFGIINAYDAVMAAKNWTSMGPELNITGESEVIDVPLQNNPAITISSSLTIEAEDSDSFVVETVYIFIKLLHGSRGDLDIRLTSPSGMESTMTSSGRPETTVLPLEEDWQLMTVRNYYESPNGKWTLSITDEHPSENDWCVNHPFVLLNETTGEPFVNPFTGDSDACALLELSALFDPANAVCLDGQVVNQEVYDDTDPETNQTAAEACCFCGGGENGVAKLVSWKIQIFGHSAEASDAGDDVEVSVEKKAATPVHANKEKITPGESGAHDADLADANIPWLSSSSGLATGLFSWMLVAAASIWMMV